MKLGLVQFNPIVGDVRGNADRILSRARSAVDAGAELVVFPELALVGYPPRDLLLEEGFLAAVRESVIALARGLPPGAAIMVGSPWSPGGSDPASWSTGARLTNSVLCLRGGVIAARYDKRLLPTYDVFDEDRYFVPGQRPVVVSLGQIRVGVSICEDLWRGGDARAGDRYTGSPDPAAELVRAGATLIVNPSASPFVLGKGAKQRRILTEHVRTLGVPLAAVNQVGGNDDLIFDGHAAVYAPDPAAPDGARLIAAGPGFVEYTLLADITNQTRTTEPPAPDPLLGAPHNELLFKALVLGVRDYAAKTGFSSAVLGLSGGIDSALVAAIGAAALGRSNVLGVLMPSRFSSPGSVEDALELGRRLGARTIKVPIEPGHAAMESVLAPVWQELGLDGAPGVTEENVQSRLRGLILMAFSNKQGSLLLTTGNKSELAVGYCTLYGDMNGGLAVLPDVTKVQVYSLARWINENHRECGFDTRPIPESSITKAPSAELRPNQTDQDSLPPYDVLDEIVDRYIVGRQSASHIERETSIDPATVRRVIRLIDVNEYKRRQMPVGLKVTGTSFGPGRRRPIAQGWRADRA